MPLLYQNDKVNSRHFFTFSDIYRLGNTVQYSGMTNEEIRRENARWLAKQCGGPTQFADRLELSQSRVSQLIGLNPVKNIGTATARKIEQAFDKPMGWLDTPNAWVREEGEEQIKEADQAHLIGAKISELISLFVDSTEDGQNQILRMARAVEKLSQSRGSASADNQS